MKTVSSLPQVTEWVWVGWGPKSGPHHCLCPAHDQGQQAHSIGPTVPVRDGAALWGAGRCPPRTPFHPKVGAAMSRLLASS